MPNRRSQSYQKALVMSLSEPQQLHNLYLARKEEKNKNSKIRKVGVEADCLEQSYLVENFRNILKG